MHKTLAAPALALAAALAAAPAAAQSVSAAWPESVVNALQDRGYRATLTTDDYGDPKIESATGGVNFSIYFYGCDDAGQACRHLQFSSGFDLPDGLSHYSANSWNTEKLVGSVSVDEEMDPFIRHFLVSVDGMSRSSFDAFLDMWDDALAEFTDYIDW